MECKECGQPLINNEQICPCCGCDNVSDINSVRRIKNSKNNYRYILITSIVFVLSIMLITILSDSTVEVKKDKYKYSSIANIKANIGNTKWIGWKFGDTSQIRLEIIFSADGKTAKINIDGNEGEYESYQIGQRNFSDKPFGGEGAELIYTYLTFSNGLMIIRPHIFEDSYCGYFQPYRVKSQELPFINPFSGGRSVSDAAYAAAYAAIDAASNSKVEYGDFLMIVETEDYK